MLPALKRTLHTSGPLEGGYTITTGASRRGPEPSRHANATTEYDEGLSPPYPHPHQPLRPPPASLPSYVEISDSDSDADPPHAPSLALGSASPPAAPSPHAQLSLFADDSAPHRRLSRALSSLSLSSDSELPSTARILHDLRRGAGRSADRDHGGSSSESEAGDVIEVSD